MGVAAVADTEAVVETAFLSAELLTVAVTMAAVLPLTGVGEETLRLSEASLGGDGGGDDDVPLANARPCRCR